MKDDHERIWLQTVEHLEGRTWCGDKVDDDDTEYIRADIAAAEIATLKDKSLAQSDRSIERLAGLALGLAEAKLEIATLTERAEAAERKVAELTQELIDVDPYNASSAQLRFILTEMIESPSDGGTASARMYLKNTASDDDGEGRG